MKGLDILTCKVDVKLVDSYFEVATILKVFGFVLFNRLLLYLKLVTAKILQRSQITYLLMQKVL